MTTDLNRARFSRAVTGIKARADQMRFIYRAGSYAWRFKPEIIPGDIDCTDMDDAQFEQFHQQMSRDV